MSRPKSDLTRKKTTAGVELTHETSEDASAGVPDFENVTIVEQIHFLLREMLAAFRRSNTVNRPAAGLV
jgi:hypothetical protein